METRYTSPSRYSKEPYGTIIKVLNEDNEPTLWIQISKDMEHPEWVSAIDLYVRMHKEVFTNEEWVKQLFKEYDV